MAEIAVPLPANPPPPHTNTSSPAPAAAADGSARNDELQSAPAAEAPAARPGASWPDERAETGAPADAAPAPVRRRDAAPPTLIVVGG
ncbi:MAG TPA: hypothetical protein VHQ65_10000, partial [Thermoanaerobaculia bacterium]|nr:hypothetical protein [Thermoanaerobaculia bacterium]